MIETIRKRDGKLAPFDSEKILSAVLNAQAARDLTDPGRAERLTREVVRELEEAFPDAPPGVEQAQDIVERKLIQFGQPEVAKAYILYRQRRAEARETKELLGVEDDLKLTVNAARVLERRYLSRDDQGNVSESPREMFERVARVVAQAEKPDDREEWMQKFLQAMSRLDFLPNSPTLMNAGTKMGQLSACFVLPVEDSMDGIFSALHHMAIVHQSGGGTGFSFSRLRPKNDPVRTAGGIASGPVSFMRIFDMATEVVRQGGRRRGANMAIMRVDHPDIREFITAKTQGDFQNFNFSVGITDAFMQAVERDQDFATVNPRDGAEVERFQARDIFDLIVTSAWQCGDPGLVFLDKINQANPLPQLGPMESTNPCGEQPLMPFESCNLGSINLLHMLKDKEIDWDRLGQTVDLGVRFLDDVIEVQRYPLDQVEKITRANRKIGLGVMGFADMLISLGVPYTSQEALELGEKLMEFVTTRAREYSAELARQREPFENFKGSRLEREGLPPQRNATVTTIAPTGTISIIAGVSSGIEPVFALTYFRRVLEGQRMLEEHPLFVEEATRRGLYSRALMSQLARKGSLRELPTIPDDLKRLFTCALDVPPDWHVQMQAAFQKHTDNAVSKTVNLSPTASQKQVREVYQLAYQLGCKGITVFRYGSKGEQTLVLEMDAEETGSCRQCAT